MMILKNNLNRENLKKWSNRMIWVNAGFIVAMYILSICSVGNDVAGVDIILSLVYIIIPIVTKLVLNDMSKKRINYFIAGVSGTFALIILGTVFQGGLLALYIGKEEYRTPTLLILGSVGLVVTLLTMTLGFKTWIYIVDIEKIDVDEKVKAFKTIWNIISTVMTIGTLIYTLGLDDKDKISPLTNFQLVFIPLSANMVMHILSFMNGEYKAIFGGKVKEQKK